MKKLVMAAAVLGAFAGTAQAQTSVTLYGIADGDVRFDKTNIGTLRSIDSGGESGSRWGIRGTEDLGGGLKANFIFEQGFDITDNSVPQGSIGGGASAGFGGARTQNHSSTGSRLFGRIATVGLAGPFGEVRFGRGYNPLFLVQATADPFGAGFVSQISNLYVNNTIRNDNAVYYDTPKFYGVCSCRACTSSASRRRTTRRTTPGQARQRSLRCGPDLRERPDLRRCRLRADQLEPRHLSCSHGDDADVSYDFGFIKPMLGLLATRNDNPSNVIGVGSRR